MQVDPTYNAWYAFDPKFTGHVFRYPKASTLYSYVQNWLDNSINALNDGPQFEFDSSTPPKIKSLSMPFLQQGLTTTSKIESNLQACRDVLDPYTPHMFPSGLTFDLYEQYIGVRATMLDALGKAGGQSFPALSALSAS